MTNKENALRIIRFDKPERVVRGLPCYMVNYLGCNHEGYDGSSENCPVGTKWTDIWGIGWDKEQEGIMGFPRIAPLAEVEDLKSYVWPDPDDERICGKIYEMADKFPGGDVFLMGSHRNLLFEKANKLVGMENLMVYFYEEPEFVREVFHKIMDFQLGIQKHYLKVGIEAVSFSEDLGGQSAPLISPNMINEFMYPEYERIFSIYREKKIITNFHSCGNVEALIDIFLKIGIDVLNPVQVTANNLDKIRELTKGRITLEGGINSATIIDGPIEKIVAEVRERIAQLGQDGGYFCTQDQYMPYPKIHLEALQKAVDEYGKYPLK